MEQATETPLPDESGLVEKIPSADNTKETKEDPAALQDYFTKLENYLLTSGVFKNPDITLVEMAAALDTNSFNLSKAIKQYSKEGSFYEYINRHRLTYFLELLARPENEQFTINALSLQAGFASSTTLNKYCKKITGHTPVKIKTLLAGGKTVEELVSSN